MANGDDVVVLALKHLSDEVAGMRGDLRKVIEIDVEQRSNKETMARLWGKVDSFDARLQAIEIQQPVAKLTRIAVFAGIGAVVMLVMTLAFQVITAHPQSPPQTINIDQARPK